VKDKYTEKVAQLFEKQRFHTCFPEERDCSHHADMQSADIVAQQDDTCIRIITSPNTSIKRLKHQAEQLSQTDSSDITKTILFTNKDLSQQQKKQLEQHCREQSVEISLFDPKKEQKKPETPENMPSSYEIIGDIAIINLDDHQLHNKHEIAKTVQKQNPNIQTVLRKKEQLQGDYRVGKYETLLGTATETTHKEHGCRYRVDPTKVYFSERLGHERERIADQISDDERIHVWFAGVGPYSILFARQHNVQVASIELNPHACTYMDQNIEMNGVQDNVTAYRGDVQQIAPTLSQPDRIVMPLPGSADDFLDTVFETANDGCIVHYYRFCSDEELWDQPLNEIQQASDAAERDFSVQHKEICGHYAPYVHRICIDFQIG